jgi:hypothetical protein
MRIWTSCGLVFAPLFAWMLYSLIAANDWDMASVVGAIVAGYAAVLHLAILSVQRWARQIAA